jgi:hypothetical protein
MNELKKPTIEAGRRRNDGEVVWLVVDLHCAESLTTIRARKMGKFFGT